MRSASLVLAAICGAALAACGGGDDASAGPDARAAIDAPAADAPASIDAAIDAAGPPLPGFGAITGQCGVLTQALLDGTTPMWFQGDLDFGTDRYDDPADRDQLTPGGQQMIVEGNAGGSSVYSEVFAYEWLARCEGATLLKTETEIQYDVQGKKADLLVEMDGRKVGVSVTRAVTFPFGQPYTLAAAQTLFQRKLSDLRLATEQVSAADHWTAQLVIAEAYDLQHAQVAMQAWNGFDAATKGTTQMIIAVTDGDDLFIYTDQ
ncbi:MAG TPA: hypothetical protein VHE35_26480 [Kofleriaceae bacterium]|nr:hypothetical protein [Kofleriaceae bacterium]